MIRRDHTQALLDALYPCDACGAVATTRGVERHALTWAELDAELGAP